MFFLSLGFIYLFIFLASWIFISLLVFLLLVTRYSLLATRYSLLRYSV